ncbi:MAG: hypothetical protein AAFY56_00460 [Pseudomonadota bacterium]
MSSFAAILLLSACGFTPKEENMASVPNGRDTSSINHSRAIPSLKSNIHLVGMADTEVAILLGEPNLDRPEAPARYWQYNYSDCTLDIFFYADKPEGQFRVAYFDLREALSPVRFRADPKVCDLLRHNFERKDDGRLSPVEIH